MKHLEFEPPAALRDAIKCFWYNCRDAGEQPAGFDVLPDGYAEIIFYFGSPCSVACDGGDLALPSPFMMGLLHQPVRFNIRHRFEVIGIRCFPWTVFDLLGLPPGHGGVRILAHPIAQLQSPLALSVSAGRIDDALAQVTQYFLQARSQVAPDSLLFKAGAALRASNGAMPVSQVAAAAHATVRTLERKFMRSSGRTVKDVSSLMRFEQVRNRLWLAPDTRLAGLASELGYTDQSHLSREFKRYSGMTPAAFARKVKLTRKGGSDFVAFVQAREGRA